MEDLIHNVTGGHVTEVKIVLTSVVTALAGYQVFLMAVGYGKLRLPFLSGRAASFTHRAGGDMIVTITLFVGIVCLGYFGIDDGLEHARPGNESPEGARRQGGSSDDAKLAMCRRRSTTCR